MALRVSNSQFYLLNTRDITRKNSELNDQIAYLSAGKQFLTAKDDAVSASKLFGLKDELAAVERYQKNIVQVENRGSVEENAFGTANDILLQVQQLMIQANNGSLGDNDIKALATQVTNNLDMLIDTANSQDESGNFTFAGYQVTQEPFVRQLDNSVIYTGDSGVRELQVAQNVFLDLNQPGDKAFMNVPNTIGDFLPTHTVGQNQGGLTVDSAKIVDRGVYDPVTFPPGYTFDFVAADHLRVTDNNGVVMLDTGPAGYTPGQTVAFNGVEVVVRGNPVPGDQFVIDPMENVSVFETLKQAIDWLNVGASPADSIEHQVEYNYILSQLNEAFNYNTTRRSDSGIRLQTAESQKNIHLDYELTVEKSRAQIEDLDYAAAVSKFEQTNVALQAAQQTFAKVQGLSLFNYI